MAKQHLPKCTYSTVKKSKDTYLVRVSGGYDINGNQLRKSRLFREDPNLTKKQNKIARDEFAYQLLMELQSDTTYEGSKMKFSTFSKMWLEKHAKNEVDVSTYESYEREIRNKFDPAFGNMIMTKIKPLHITDFFLDLVHNGYIRYGKHYDYQYSSIKRWYNILNKMFKVAMQWELIEKNPCEAYKPKNSKNKNDKDIICFSLEETQIFLQALSSPYNHVYKEHTALRNNTVINIASYSASHTLSLQFQVLYQLAIFGGFRRSEMLALTWDKIDFEKNEITINCAAAIIYNKQVKKTTKTRSSVRQIKMPQSFMALLKIYKKEQMELRMSLGDAWATNDDGTPCNFLFIQKDGKQICLSTPNDKLKKFIKYHNANVDSDDLKLPPITFHSLRHTSATLLLSDQSTDYKTVSSRLGHANTTTTLNIYYHTCKKKDEVAADFMENIIKMAK